jgi:hypothetical protein
MSWQLITLTPEASSWAMLVLGFGGFGLAAFSVGMKVGQIAGAAWWKGKLQEALTSTRELPPRPATLFRDRRELARMAGRQTDRAAPSRKLNGPLTRRCEKEAVAGLSLGNPHAQVHLPRKRGERLAAPLHH